MAGGGVVKQEATGISKETETVAKNEVPPVDELADEEVEVVAEEPVEPVVETIASVDELLAEVDLGVEYVKLPTPYKGGVRVRPLTMHEMHVLRKNSTRKVKDQRGKVKEVFDEELSNKMLIRMSLVEPAMTAQQIDALFLRNNKLATAILRVLTRLNGISEEESEEAVAEAEAEFPE